MRTKKGQVSFNCKVTNDLLMFLTLFFLQDVVADSSSELGELLISLCHNPTDQKLTVKISCARGLHPITKDGRLSE